VISINKGRHNRQPELNNKKHKHKWNVTEQRKRLGSKEEYQRQEAQRKQEAAEGARRFAEDQSRRKQEQLREQARLDREAAKKADELAEREELKVAEVTKEAEEARRVRAAAEQRLAEIRSRIEAADREKRQALSQSQEAEATQAKQPGQLADNKTRYTYDDSTLNLNAMVVACIGDARPHLVSRLTGRIMLDMGVEEFGRRIARANQLKRTDDRFCDLRLQVRQITLSCAWSARERSRERNHTHCRAPARRDRYFANMVIIWLEAVFFS
jgi:hypothetical protein